VAAYFDTAYRFLLFVPGAIIPDSAQLESICEAALATASTSQDKEAARSATVFLNQLFARCDGLLAPFKPQIDALVTSPFGERATLRLVQALTESAHPHLRPNLATCLYALVHNFCENGREDLCYQWVERALAGEALAAKGVYADAAGHRRLTDCFLGLARISRPRFKAMLMDLAKICAREATADALVGYFI